MFEKSCERQEHLDEKDIRCSLQAAVNRCDTSITRSLLALNRNVELSMVKERFSITAESGYTEITKVILGSKYSSILDCAGVRERVMDLSGSAGDDSRSKVITILTTVHE